MKKALRQIISNGQSFENFCQWPLIPAGWNAVLMEIRSERSRDVQNIEGYIKNSINLINNFTFLTNPPSHHSLQNQISYMKYVNRNNDSKSAQTQKETN